MTVATSGTSTDAYVVTLSEGGQVAIPKFMRPGTRPGERFLIVRVGDGYYLKPVRTLDLVERVREVQSALNRRAKAAGLGSRDLERISARVRKGRRLP